MIKEAIKAADELVTLIPFLGHSTRKQDYEQALDVIEHLLEQAPDSPLIALLMAKIESYEDNVPELVAFNARIEALPRGWQPFVS